MHDNTTPNAAGYWSKAVTRETERANRNHEALDAANDEIHRLAAIVASVRAAHAAVTTNAGTIICGECGHAKPCKTWVLSTIGEQS